MVVLFVVLFERYSALAVRAGLANPSRQVSHAQNLGHSAQIFAKPANRATRGP